MKRGLDFIISIGHVLITNPGHRNDNPGIVIVEYFWKLIDEFFIYFRKIHSGSICLAEKGCRLLRHRLQSRLRPAAVKGYCIIISKVKPVQKNDRCGCIGKRMDSIDGCML